MLSKDGSRSSCGIEIGLNSIGFLSGRFLHGLVFMLIGRSGSEGRWARGGDAILPRKGPVTRAMSKRLQEDWARANKEGLRVLMNLRVDFGPMG